jgi:hypothetical protein
MAVLLPYPQTPNRRTLLTPPSSSPSPPISAHPPTSPSSHLAQCLSNRRVKGRRRCWTAWPSSLRIWRAPRRLDGDTLVTVRRSSQLTHFRVSNAVPCSVTRQVRLFPIPFLSPTHAANSGIHPHALYTPPSPPSPSPLHHPPILLQHRRVRHRIHRAGPLRAGAMDDDATRAVPGAEGGIFFPGDEFVWGVMFDGGCVEAEVAVIVPSEVWDSFW